MEHATHTCIHGLAAATVPRTCVVVPSSTDAQAVMPTPTWVRRVSIASAVHSQTTKTPRPRIVPASPPHDLLGCRGDRFRTNGRLPAVLSSSSARGGHVEGTSLLVRPQPVLVRIPKVVCRHGRDPCFSHRTSYVRDVIRKHARRSEEKTKQDAHRHCTGRTGKEANRGKAAGNQEGRQLSKHPPNPPRSWVFEVASNG